MTDLVDHASFDDPQHKKKTTPPPKYTTATGLILPWAHNVLSNTPPILYPLGKGELAGIEIGPNRVLGIAAPPGWGKTALVMQLAIDALRLSPKLRVLIANVEMTPEDLLDRQLSRLSGVHAKKISRRRIPDEQMPRVRDAIAVIYSLGDRLAFVRPPFNLANVVKATDDHHADLIVVDYIQRFSPAGESPTDARSRINAVIEDVRTLAMDGKAIIVVSAVGRGANGNYTGLTMGSFRESSELEYGLDDGFLLVPPDGLDADCGTMVLKHVKHRHGKLPDMKLKWDSDHQSFTAGEGGGL